MKKTDEMTDAWLLEQAKKLGLKIKYVVLVKK